MFKEYIAQVLKNAKAMAAALIDKGYTLVSGTASCSRHDQPRERPLGSESGGEREKRLVTKCKSRQRFKFMMCRWANVSVAVQPVSGTENRWKGSLSALDSCPAFNLLPSAFLFVLPFFSSDLQRLIDALKTQQSLSVIPDIYAQLKAERPNPPVFPIKPRAISISQKHVCCVTARSEGF